VEARVTPGDRILPPGVGGAIRSTVLELRGTAMSLTVTLDGHGTTIVARDADAA